MNRTDARHRSTLLALCLLSLLLAAVPATAQPGVPPPPRPFEPYGPEITVDADGGEPALAAFEDGSWVAAWREPDGVTLRARRYGADDEPLGPSMVVGPAAAPPGGPLPGLSAMPAVTALDGGRWAVAWIENTCDACGDDVMISLYDGATPIAERLLVSGAPDYFRSLPVLASNGTDRLAVGWTQMNGGPTALPPENDLSDVYARLFDFDADPVSDAFRVNEESVGEQILHGAAFLTSGDLVFAWQSWGGESFLYDVYVRRFDDTGQPLGGDSRANADEGRNVQQLDPAVTAWGQGFVVTWTDYYRSPLTPMGAPFNGTIVGRYYTDSGNPLSGEMVFSDPSTPGDRNRSAVAVSGDDQLVVWEHGCFGDVCDTHPDSPDGSRHGIFAFSSRSLTTAEPLQVNREANGDQLAPAVAAVPDGFVTAWVSRRLAGKPNGPGPSRVVARRVGPQFCEELCLQDRFEIEVTWKDFQGNVGRGVPVQRTDDWGTFWFFRPENVELAVKVLDGRAINGHWWLFYASLTNVEYTLRLTEHVQRFDYTVRDYENPSGHFGSLGDTAAVPMILPTPSTVPPWEVGATSAPVMLVPLPAEALADGALAATALATPSLTAADAPLSPATFGPCPDGAVCLGADERWAVTIEWQDFFANSGAGVGAPLTTDTGWFWFFRDTNPEVLVKVLDGRKVNGHWWVFYAALTNVGFELHVTDRMTDDSVTYHNPLGEFASRGDTEAFDG